MKILFLILFCSSSAWGGTGLIDKVRVFQKPDGKVSILHIVEKACGTKESPEQCFQRIATEDCPKIDGKCLPYKDILVTQLPSRENRAKWRWDSGKQEIFVDESVITPKDIEILGQVLSPFQWAYVKKEAENIQEEYEMVLLELEKLVLIDAQWAIMKSTSTTKDEKVDALIEMEKIRRGE